MDITTPQIVILTWSDAWGDTTGVVSLKDVLDNHRPETIHTIGWLLRDDEVGVSLANEKCSDATYRGRTFVPRGMVVSLQPYKLTVPKIKKVKAPTLQAPAQSEASDMTPL